VSGSTRQAHQENAVVHPSHYTQCHRVILLTINIESYIPMYMNSRFASRKIHQSTHLPITPIQTLENAARIAR
jgi:hypothetical protein